MWVNRQPHEHLLDQRAYSEEPGHGGATPSQEHGGHCDEFQGPVATDIVFNLFRYYQLKFKYLILLGKPIKGVVVNAWMAEVLFDMDTAAGKLARYQELRKYLQ